MQHGGGSIGLRKTAELKKGSPYKVDPSRYPGYSYLLGKPTPEQRCKLGADVAHAREVLSALVALLPQPGSPDETDASDVPSGYTYLLQFVAHDLVQTTIPFWAAADITVVSRNMRSAGLQLDTLYGGGPTVCPGAFEPSGKIVPPVLGPGLPPDNTIAVTADDRTILRLGRTATGRGALDTSDGPCPFRDLPRVNVNKALGPPADADNTVNFDQAFQICIADGRNADTVILSQLTVLFSIVHNIIAHRMDDLPPQAAFSYARVAVLYMYYAIIAKDLLPRILHEFGLCPYCQPSPAC